MNAPPNYPTFPLQNRCPPAQRPAYRDSWNSVTMFISFFLLKGGHNNCIYSSAMTVAFVLCATQNRLWLYIEAQWGKVRIHLIFFWNILLKTLSVLGGVWHIFRVCACLHAFGTREVIEGWQRLRGFGSLEADLSQTKWWNESDWCEGHCNVSLNK